MCRFSFLTEFWEVMLDFTFSCLNLTFTYHHILRIQSKEIGRWMRKAAFISYTYLFVFCSVFNYILAIVVCLPDNEESCESSKSGSNH